MSALSHFDRDTAVQPLSEGVFAVSLSQDWSAVVGPNGGYLAAIILRAMIASVAEPGRAPRSLHLRYLAPAAYGPAQVQVRSVRSGRTVSVLSASMLQGDKEVVSASAVFGVTASQLSFCDARRPDLPPIEQCEPLPKRLPINERYQAFRGLGGELRQGERALSGGYIRLADPRLADSLLMAALWDAWPPTPIYRRMQERSSGGAPTLEASVYFRAVLPLPEFTPSDYFGLRVESLALCDGYFEESGEIWSPSGVLLAQSRQLAMLY